MPESVFQFALRTREAVLLHDASALGAFVDDAYVRRHQVHSVLCLPLFKQTRLVGLIYLENNLASGVFTPARVAVLTLLASEAAISLENARLLSEHKRDQETLNRLNTDLAHVSRIAAVSALTASIAHEVSQPLSGIITNASASLRMLEADPPNVDRAREVAKRIMRDGTRAAAVVERVRALYSKKEFMLEPLDINEVIREVLALTLGDLQRGRVILQPELADDLPRVTGDRVQLQQVMLNLLRNAFDAMADVDDRPRQLIVGTGRDDGDGVRVTVRDVGVGVDRERMPKLFDPFYTTKSSGMGIGLFISQSIIEGHHGRIWAEPNDGPGVAFSFYIPCAPASAAPAHLGS